MAEGNKYLLNNLCYVGKVHGVGGGRGIFAASEIRSGTKVISEEPVLEVPVSAGVESDLHSALVRKMLLELGPEERNQALEVCSSLHPVALSDCRAADVEALHVRLLPTIERLKNEGNHGLSSEALLRLMLAMQFNAFYSAPAGLYPTLALINHSCRPNCIKLAPRGGKGAGGGGRSSSEVWATRDIARGEEITISYLHPSEQSAACRQRQFLEQHLQPLGPSPHPPELEELLPGADPGELRLLEDRLDGLTATGPDEPGCDVRLGALRAALDEAQRICGPRHLVLARVHRMLKEAALSALSCGAAPAGDLALDLAGWCHELLATQVPGIRVGPRPRGEGAAGECGAGRALAGPPCRGR